MSATRTTQPSSVEGRRVLMVDSSAMQASTKLSSCSKVDVSPRRSTCWANSPLWQSTPSSVCSEMLRRYRLSSTRTECTLWLKVRPVRAR